MGDKLTVRSLGGVGGLAEAHERLAKRVTEIAVGLIREWKPGALRDERSSGRNGES